MQNERRSSGPVQMSLLWPHQIASENYSIYTYGMTIRVEAGIPGNLQKFRHKVYAFNEYLFE